MVTMVFETLGLDLMLVKSLSIWKENNENPLMFMTGSCVSFFFVRKNTSEVSFEPSIILRRNSVGENYKCNHMCAVSLLNCFYSPNFSISISVVKTPF